MDPRRTTLVGAIALCVIAGLTAANVVLFHPAGQNLPAAPATHWTMPPHPALAPPADQRPVAAERMSLSEPLRIDEQALGPLRPVDARLDLDGPAPHPPNTLGGTQAAVPLPQPPATDREILAVIDEELPAASQMEREVWLEELRDVGPETTRRVLRLWKQQHPATSRPPAHPLASEEPLSAPRPDPTDEVAVFSVETGLDREQLIAQLGSSLDGIRQARDVILNNVANAGTIGFKRSEVLFGEADSHAQADHCEDGQGVRVTAWSDSLGAGADVAEVRLDPAAGRLERTGRPLDVAVSGAGFLQVRRGAEVLLTRAGRLSRGDDGQLVLPTPRGPFTLEPPVTVPDEAADVEIARDGAVLVRLAGQESPFEAGRILVARCADPSALAPRGGSLFAATAASGPPYAGMPGSDGLGKLRQGVLEQSNVDLEREVSAFRRLQSRIDVLSQIISGAIPFASARPMNLVAAPPDEGDGNGPEPPRGPALIEQYLETRQAEHEGGPELR